MLRFIYRIYCISLVQFVVAGRMVTIIWVLEKFSWIIAAKDDLVPAPRKMGRARFREAKVGEGAHLVGRKVQIVHVRAAGFDVARALVIVGRAVEERENDLLPGRVIGRPIFEAVGAFDNAPLPARPVHDCQLVGKSSRVIEFEDERLAVG